MKESTEKKVSPARVRKSGLDGVAAGEIRQRRGHTLGLRTFENISAIEGIRLSGEMREDLLSLDARQMDEGQRSRFITEKYGRT